MGEMYDGYAEKLNSYGECISLVRELMATSGRAERKELAKRLLAAIKTYKETVPEQVRRYVKPISPMVEDDNELERILSGMVEE